MNDWVCAICVTGGFTASLHSKGKQCLQKLFLQQADFTTAPVVSSVREDTELWTVNAYTKKLQDIQLIVKFYVYI